MSANFRLVDRDTAYLLPPSVDDWLPEDHLARFVVEIVDQLDISDVEGSYIGSGSQAYHPRMMLALLFYSYATGTFSSRKMETATYESVPMRYVAANQHPDHDTICTFRRRFLSPLSDLFTQILLIAHQMELVEIGDVAIDGSKVNANASKHKAMSWERACQLEEQLSREVAEMMARAEEADSDSIDTESLPEEIAHRTDRLNKIRAAKAMIEQRAEQRYQAEKAAYEKKMADRKEKEERTGKKTPGRKPSPPDPGPEDSDQVNFTDAESRIMLTSSNGWQQAYNVQHSVDMDSYMILGGHLTQATNDKQQLTPAVDALEALPDELGTLKRLAADSGYFSQDNVENVTGRQITPYIAKGRQTHHPDWKERLTKADPPPDDPTPVEAMQWRLSTQQGRDFYARRKSTVETVFGIIKGVMGFRQFLLRGVKKASGELKLLQCAYNLKRMHVLAGD
jgi:transposase